MSGVEHEQFERQYLADSQKMKDEAEAREDYTLRCIMGEKVFYNGGSYAVLPGHIYSQNGRQEYGISRCCEFHFDRMFDEQHMALREVTGGIDRVLYTGVVWGSYQGDSYEQRYATMNPADADVVSSEIYGKPGKHVVALDIDVPARLVPSSTEGHHHLHVDVECEWEDYADFLRAAAKIGLIEEGYANVSIQRKGTHLRVPWVRKPKFEELVTPEELKASDEAWAAVESAEPTPWD